jgi:hypothetical protein
MTEDFCKKYETHCIMKSCKRKSRKADPMCAVCREKNSLRRSTDPLFGIYARNQESQKDKKYREWFKRTYG